MPLFWVVKNNNNNNAPNKVPARDNNVVRTDNKAADDFQCT